MEQAIKTLKSQIESIENLKDEEIEIYIEKMINKIKKGM